MILFSKGNSQSIVSIGKFLSQLYITTQLRRAISSQYLFQRLNLSRVVLRTNTCRVKTSCYALRRVVRANHSESLIRSSKVHLILVSGKHEMYITPEVKDYATPVVCKNSLTDFSSENNPTLIVSKCSDVIPYKFKAVRFTIK